MMNFKKSSASGMSAFYVACENFVMLILFVNTRIILG